MRFITRSILERPPLLCALAVIATASSGCEYYNQGRLRSADKDFQAAEKRMKQIEEDANNIHRAKRSSASEK